MATPLLQKEVTVYVKYRGKIRQWVDTVFNVPVTNILTSSGRDPHIPLVGEEVVVKQANRSGRMRTWRGVVVAESEQVEERELFEMNELDGVEEVSPRPPGSVNSSPRAGAPPAKKSRLQGEPGCVGESKWY